MRQTIKLFCASLLFVLAIFAFSGIIYAQESDDFVIDAVTSYTVSDEENAHVIQEITLTNTKEFIYAPEYSISLTLKNISDIKVFNAKGAIPFTLKEDGDSKTIHIEFEERVVGVGQKNSFSISFTTSDYVRKEGDNYTVSIPPFSRTSDFRTYEVLVAVPEVFDSPSLVKPEVAYSQNDNVFVFSKDQIASSGVVLIFGEKQYYKFTLLYNLENNNLFPVNTEIAIPLNTAYQNVIVDQITPKPQSVSKDTDGNVLAKYSLKPNSKLQVKAVVLVETFLRPTSQKLSEKDRKAYLRPQKYWETQNPEVKKAAKNLKSAQDIYNYVVKALSYDNKKIGDANERLGAVKALREPFFAVCLEFSDLFVALARAKGIPARNVEGFAYTQNSALRPVSLFEDVLHVWPEYYDDSKKTWIMVDPTWADTTNGIDYFHTFDLDHVAFVKNGLSSTYPVPAGGYKTGKSQDVQVEFITPQDFKRVESNILGAQFSPFVTNGNITGSITYLNMGNFETSPGELSVFVDNQKSASVSVPSAPPLGSSNISIYIPVKTSGFLTNISHTITMQDRNGKTLYSKTIHVFPIPAVIIIGGVVLSGLLIIFIITIKTRRLSVFRRK